jgi:hypothetical protein
MRRFLPLALLLVGLICSVSLLAADEKKDADKKEAPKTDSKDKSTKEKLGAGGSFVGTLTRVEGAQKYLTVQISEQVPTGGNLNLGALKKGSHPSLSGGGGTKQVTHNIELQASDSMKVRMMQPPVDFDDKGRPKKYTPREIKALKKGEDAKLPGFAADFDSLKANQVVQVYLSKSKHPHKPAAKAKTKDGDAESPPAEKPEVTMIVILKEPPK